MASILTAAFSCQVKYSLKKKRFFQTLIVWLHESWVQDRELPHDGARSWFGGGGPRVCLMLSVFTSIYRETRKWLGRHSVADHGFWNIWKPSHVFIMLLERDHTCARVESGHAVDLHWLAMNAKMRISRECHVQFSLSFFLFSNCRLDLHTQTNLCARNRVRVFR